ncbi:helix-turn-helix domain-containing protein [Variovorax sp. HW608]|uniref:helix-turn-helix domain-containing protein n=1 Tax=Variovorax sp. HW608 TaxID=1034889 RepID=UPI000B5AF51B
MHMKFRERPNVAKMAAAASMSRSAFSLAFRQAMGCPPAQYLAKLRIAEAEKLLKTTRLTRDEIAHRVGFESAVGLYLALRSHSRSSHQSKDPLKQCAPRLARR